jgi:hypothetical protein
LQDIFNYISQMWLKKVKKSHQWKKKHSGSIKHYGT